MSVLAQAYQYQNEIARKPICIRTARARRYMSIASSIALKDPDGALDYIELARAEIQSLTKAAA